MIELAQITNPAIPKLETQANQDGIGFFQSLLPRIVALALVIGLLIFFFMMITGAIQWITSGGDKAALEGARGKIGNAVVGLIILLALFALIKVLEGFFGVNILLLDIGPLKIQ